MIRVNKDVIKLERKMKNADVWWTLQISDVHFDSQKCDRELLTKHLKEAEKRNATVVINGDFFDVMGIKSDPRSSYSDIRKEYLHTNYLDVVVEDAISYLRKFKVDYVIGRGNHESNIYRRQQTDVTQRLVDGLKPTHNVIDFHYSNWVLYKMVANDKVTKIIKHHLHHGAGGNAKRSKGVLNADINLMQFPDADIITRGHDHNKWYLPVTVQKLDQKQNLVATKIHLLQTGSYKMKSQTSGWEVEKGFNEPTLGGWWLGMSLIRKIDGASHTIKVEEA